MDVRALTIDHAADVTALINRYERFWDQPVVTPMAEVIDDITEPFVDLALDSRGYWLDGSLIAYGLVGHRPSGERLERAYLRGAVDPEFRGQGVGRQLLGWQIERARESLSKCDPSIPWYVRADEWEWIEDTHRLYRRFGMEPVRYFKDMIRPLDSRVEVRVPRGVAIVSWDRGRDEQARQAQNEAFADHWGSTPVDDASFQHRLEAVGSRLDLSFLALARDEVVGLCLNGNYPDDETVTGRRDGWVEVLGVRRGWRGKHVASALLATSLNAFLGVGMTHSMIGVDAENPSGAFGLYQRMGYEVLHGTIASQLAISPVPIP